ncbi:MAG: Hsp20/alpha crystallin family protein [Caldicoprobacterales bacterium]|jgi:HSP20 family protein|nr:Hsp20/alpha crystallin family protein [Clostridiales bacterium]
MFGLTPINRRNSLGTRRSMDLFDLDSWFDNFFRSAFRPTFYGFDHQMKVDIKDNEKNYVIEAELPGVDKSEINVELRDDILTIGVQRNEITEEERENYIHKERRTSSMSRSFQVENVQPQDIKARFDNGVLVIELPKSEIEAKKQHRIDIN